MQQKTVVVALVVVVASSHDTCIIRSPRSAESTGQAIPIECRLSMLRCVSHACARKGRSFWEEVGGGT